MGACSDPISGLATYATNAADISASSEYNALGMLTATVDARGLRSTFEYDHLQRLTNSTVGVVGGIGDPAPLVTTYEYDKNSGGSVFSSSGFKSTKVTDPRGYVTETDYDALYRAVETRANITLTEGEVAKSQMGYDALGNLLFATNWVSSVSNQVVETLYDDLNRPCQVLNPDGTEVGIAYTGTGLKWQTTNEFDRVSTVQYDLAGRPVKTISPALTDGSQAETGKGVSPRI